MQLEFEEFINLIRNSKFFEAHEALEKIWFPNRKSEIAKFKILKGFINSAVSFELIKKGRNNQAETPWKTYLKYSKLIEFEDNIDKKIYLNAKEVVQNKKLELSKL